MYKCIFPLVIPFNISLSSQSHILRLERKRVRKETALNYWTHKRKYNLYYGIAWQSFSSLIEGEWCIYTSATYATIGSDNGLSPVWHQAIIWTNAWILLIGLLLTGFNEIFIKIHAFSFAKIHVKMFTWKWWLFCLGLNVLNACVSPSHFSLTVEKDSIAKKKWYGNYLLLASEFFA